MVNCLIYRSDRNATWHALVQKLCDGAEYQRERVKDAPIVLSLRLRLSVPRRSPCLSRLDEAQRYEGWTTTMPFSFLTGRRGNDPEAPRRSVCIRDLFSNISAARHPGSAPRMLRVERIAAALIASIGPYYLWPAIRPSRTLLVASGTEELVAELHPRIKRLPQITMSNC
ncbi:hypothetical protein B0H12DRAFT_686097 [Mycena haematopus]|nr:hypothetical protein B0H12DRAFT_686097 [Mycena haematopus]